MPPGSVVHGTGRTALGALAAVTAAVHRFPWAVPCVTLPQGEAASEPLLALVSELRGRLATTLEPVTLGAILRAVTRRPAPTPELIARYVATRVSALDLEPLLLEQVWCAVAPSARSADRSSATYSRRFRQYGGYTARDWRAITRLTLSLGGQREDGGGPLLGLRTRVRHSHRYLALSWTAVAERVGWEWALEQALRVGGYVSEPPVVA